jgi:aldehyde dehydrogenase (NAD+)
VVVTDGSVRHPGKLFIGGEWVDPAGSDVIEVINPATEAVLATVPAGTAADVDKAVAAAKAAFPAWSATTPGERSGYLGGIAKQLTDRAEEIATLISAEMGSPIGFSTAVQVGLPIAVAGSYAELANSFEFEEEIGNSLVVREPIGVVGAITPWNYPLHQVVAKVAAALAAGCTVVLKPSEVAPLAAYALAEAVEDAGVPAGVFNLVTGTGVDVGEPLVSHPDVDMVSFTGSTRAGRRVSELAAGTIKKVSLELGGKSANVILPDADFAAAVKNGLANCYINGGQTCTAWTRMLVPADKHDEIVKLAVEVAQKYTVGDPSDSSTRIGPMVSEAQRDRVRSYIEKGIEEGATLATGGPTAPDGLDTGYYIRPTVFANVRPDSTIAQEEIFGPVLSVIPYNDVDEAVEIANNTIYGLAGAVFAGDEESALAVAKRLRTGQVTVNGGNFNPVAPFGGYRQSGNGRELGKFGLEEFLEVKSIQR